MTRHPSRRRAPLVTLAALLLAASACGPTADQRQEAAALGTQAAPERISSIQLTLMYSGFHPGQLDGAIGAGTRASIREFQNSVGLPVSGYLSDETRARFAELDRRAGPFSVRRMQEALRAAGFDPGRIDGVAGSRTFEALTRFQGAKGLPLTGWVNPATWSALKAHMEPSNSSQS